jgi:hypothetical protein
MKPFRDVITRLVHHGLTLARLGLLKWEMLHASESKLPG